MRRARYAKIVATLGPASSSAGMLARLFAAGVDVFRLNFSHGTQREHRARIRALRALEQRTGRPIGVMLDLQGPKLRVGKFAEGQAQVRTGARLRLELNARLGDDGHAPLPHPEVFSALQPGTEVQLDDGRIALRVESAGADYADTEVITGGTLSDHKGVNVPGVLLPIAALTPKDRADLAFGLELGVDIVAASFIQRAGDLAELRRLAGNEVTLMAKIEKPSAIEHLEEIVTVADALMVARGDLGVELPPEKVPAAQKRIVRTCREAGKPVVVATQMLESMIQAPVPTRAEASDVASAVYDGADAVMLSGETAVGRYPVEAVTMMERIIAETERDPYYRKLIVAQTPPPQPNRADAISDALRAVAHTLPVAAIIAFTSSGSTSLRVARERPEAPILGLTPERGTARRLSLVWGVHPVHTADVRHVTEMVETASRIAMSQGFAKEAETLVIAAGIPFGHPGTTNMLRIARAGEHPEEQ